MFQLEPLPPDSGDAAPAFLQGAGKGGATQKQVPFWQPNR